MISIEQVDKFLRSNVHCAFDVDMARSSLVLSNACSHILRANHVKHLVDFLSVSRQSQQAAIDQQDFEDINIYPVIDMGTAKAQLTKPNDKLFAEVDIALVPAVSSAKNLAQVMFHHEYARTSLQFKYVSPLGDNGCTRRALGDSFIKTSVTFSFNHFLKVVSVTARQYEGSSIVSQNDLRLIAGDKVIVGGVEQNSNSYFMNYSDVTENAILQFHKAAVEMYLSANSQLAEEVQQHLGSFMDSIV